MIRFKLSTRTISEIGVFAALGFVFDELQSAISRSMFPLGGSIGFAMIAVLIVGLRRGFIPALITGLIMGALDICTGATILNPAQALLDYIFPYVFVAIGTLAVPFFHMSKNKSEKILWLISIAFVGGLCKLLSHYLAGIFFWNDPAGFAWGLNDMNVYLYAFLYNVAAIGPSIVLTAVLLILIYLRTPKVMEYQEEFEEEEKVENNLPSLLPLTIFMIGLSIAMFGIYLYRYIDSIEYYEYEVDGVLYREFEADGDAQFLNSLSLITAIIMIINLIRYFKNKETVKRELFELISITSASFIYGLARLIKMYVKNKETSYYWQWSLAALVVLLGTIALAIIITKRKKTN